MRIQLFALADRDTLNVPLDDINFLVKFLRSNKFNVDAAYQHIKNYYKFKQDNSDLFELSLPTMKSVYGNEVIQTLPVSDKNGRRVFIFNLKNWNPETSSNHDIVRTSLLSLEMLSVEQQYQLNGALYIMDLADFTYRQIFTVKISLLTKFIEFVYKYQPVALGEVIVLNTNFLFNSIFAILKPFLSEELLKIIRVDDTNYENVIDLIGAENLPQRYGGKLNDDVPFGMKCYEAAERNVNFLERLDAYGFNKTVVNGQVNKDFVVF